MIDPTKISPFIDNKIDKTTETCDLTSIFGCALFIFGVCGS